MLKSFEDFPQMFSYHFFCLNKSSQPLDAETKKEMEKRKNAWCCISPRFFALKKAFLMFVTKSIKEVPTSKWVHINSERTLSFLCNDAQTFKSWWAAASYIVFSSIYFFVSTSNCWLDWFRNMNSYEKIWGDIFKTHIFSIVIFRIDLRASTRIFGFIFPWSLAGSLS